MVTSRGAQNAPGTSRLVSTPYVENIHAMIYAILTMAVNQTAAGRTMQPPR